MHATGLWRKDETLPTKRWHILSANETVHAAGADALQSTRNSYAFEQQQVHTLGQRIAVANLGMFTNKGRMHRSLMCCPANTVFVQEMVSIHFGGF